MLGFDQALQLVGHGIEGLREFHRAVNFSEHRRAAIGEAERIFSEELRRAPGDGGDGEGAVGIAGRELQMRVVGADGEDEIFVHPAEREFHIFGEDCLHHVLRLVLVAEQFLDLRLEVGLHARSDGLPRVDGDAPEVESIRELELAEFDAGRQLRAHLLDARFESLVDVGPGLHGFEREEKRRQVALHERREQFGRDFTHQLCRIRRRATAHPRHEAALKIGGLKITNEIHPRQELVGESHRFGEDDFGAHECFEEILRQLRLAHGLPLAEELLEFAVLLHHRQREQGRGPLRAAQLFPEIVQAVVRGEGLDVLRQTRGKSVGGAEGGDVGGRSCCRRLRSRFGGGFRRLACFLSGFLFGFVARGE